MKEIIDIIVNFLKSIFCKKSKKIETEEIIEPKVKRLTYTKRTD